MKQVMTWIVSVMLLVPAVAQAEAVVGQVAPAFEVVDANGKMQSLASNKGKWVVLEWFNKDCPFVKKHYSVGNMQKIQKDYADKGVIWFSVLSSAKGKEGHTDAAASLKVLAENKSAATAFLLDEKGTIGKAYGAKTTPHMFIINPEGKVAYAGGIDDNDSASSKVIATSKNYVRSALDESLAGKPITVSTTRPYGCSVKY